ncbi:protein-tyrosine-phosphatase, partial [Salmonella enterica subsp. enterica serovar Virchow]|nr:protein-tyrosine-phosphatase [Salmonella enterica subsp. enterica serovar Virchow]
MTGSPERHIRLEAAFNVRDLGGYRTSSGATTRWRSLLRADALHKLTESDINALLVLGVRTVIDLRSAEELSKQPSIFGSRSEVCYHHIPLFDGLAPPHVML